MQHTSRALLGLLAVAAVGVVCLLPVAEAAAQPLRISEVLCGPRSDWDGDGEVDSRSDEWVEIVNVTDQTLSLEHLYLRDGTGEGYHYGFSGTLIPGQARVVTGTHAQIWQAANSTLSSGLSLNNTGERVELWLDDPAASPILMDVVDVPPHAAVDDRAYALDLDDGSYVLHDALAPYSGDFFPAGNGCPPSPGVAGTCDGSVPTAASSWGRVKGDYHVRSER